MIPCLKSSPFFLSLSLFIGERMHNYFNLWFIVLGIKFFLDAKVAASWIKKHDVMESNTTQKCNDVLCKCGFTNRYFRPSICTQECLGQRCKTLTCSAKNCIQKCKNCHMVCASDVEYCEQQCLSGACNFTCNAKKCMQDCNGKPCNQVPPDNTVVCGGVIIPLFYLVILAVLFATTSILSFALLIMSFEDGNYKVRRGFAKIREVLMKTLNFYIMNTLVALRKRNGKYWERITEASTFGKKTFLKL